MSIFAQAGDTIFALSSGAMPAAIAIVRISGPSAGDVLQSLAGRLPPPRMAKVAGLRSADGQLLDRALVLWLPGPDTSTGEDMAELHLHGGRAVVTAVSAALGALPGVRAAEAGEFTRRAFANGRLDLTQAEGLADLLAAETESQRRQSLRVMEGGLGRLVEGWRARLVRLSAHVEAAIEFGEEEEDVPALGAAEREELAALAGEIASALAAPPAERLRDGVRVVIAGPVNAGKSTLINALSGREVAIATEVPGTTRDLVEAPVILGGVPMILTDSAGLRETQDTVEAIGIARAEDAIAAADIVLWLGAPDALPPGSNIMLVHAQADRRERSGASADGAISVSAVTGQGMDALRTALAERASSLLGSEDRTLLNSRQRAALADVHAALDAGQKQIDPILIAESLRLSRLALDRLVGRAGVEDMLNALFGQFCIGK